MGLWPTIEWLAANTHQADATVPRQEATAIIEALATAEARALATAQELRALEERLTALTQGEGSTALRRQS